MKNKLKICTASILGTIILTGCSTNMTPPMTDAAKNTYLAEHNPYKISHYINSEIFMDNNLREGFYIQKIPDINSTATAEIGENMYQKINVFKTREYRIKFIDSSYNDKFSTMDMTLRKDNNKHNTICSNDNYNKFCLINTSDDYYFDTIVNLSKFSEQKLDSLIAYKYEQKILLNEDSFKYIALYQGKIGNKIKISYREFIKNMSRPAFTQNINYELNKNKTTIIGFKGLRIEVFKATNFNITYRVIHDYNH